AMHQQQGSGGNSSHIIDRANQLEATEPLLGRMGEIIIPDGTNTAEMVDDRLWFINLGKEGKFCWAGTGNNGGYPIILRRHIYADSSSTTKAKQR
ncbi:unnamed protein product, partial [marine sediment metagenome]